MQQAAHDIENGETDQCRTQAALIVEKGRGPACGVQRRLQAKGVSVDRAADGDEALRLLARRSYALVTIDSDVDDGQGLALLDRVVAETPDIPVVMISGSATVRHAVEALQRGAVDYLMQPVSAEALEACLQSILSRRPADKPLSSDASSVEDKPFITACPAVERILETGRAVAGSNATVLITGESGTGKEVLAAYIHRHSGRPEAPFVAVNCAALPDTLMESELFGYEKGAFTGALKRKRGKFEQAGRGTIVLDEISEMPLALQAKLLRVLQDRRIDPVGGERQISLEAQIIAISNRDLAEAVRGGRLREDLYYRINVIPLHLPPLRERRMDVPLLVQHFCDRYSRLYRRPLLTIDASRMAALERRDWRGNVRELENAIERAVLLGSLDAPPGREDGGNGNAPGPETSLTIRPGLSVKAVEEALIKSTLHEVNDHRERAAKMLGISVRTLRNKLKEYRQRNETPGKELSS